MQTKKRYKYGLPFYTPFMHENLLSRDDMKAGLKFFIATIIEKVGDKDELYIEDKCLLELLGVSLVTIRKYTKKAKEFNIIGAREEKGGNYFSILDHQYDKTDKPGFIYLIKTENGHYKIGKSKKPETRLTALSTSQPYNLTLLHTIPVNYMSQAENFLHKKFKHSRLKGEWFSLIDSEVEWICSLTKLEPREDF